MLSCKVYAWLILDSNVQKWTCAVPQRVGGATCFHTRQLPCFKNGVLAAVKLIFRYWAAFSVFWQVMGEISDSRIRRLGGMLALPCHVAVTGGWVGSSCRAADSGDGRRGRTWRCTAGHVTHYTSTSTHKTYFRCWERPGGKQQKWGGSWRTKSTIPKNMDYAMQMAVRIRLTPVLPINWFMRSHES